MNLGSKYNIEHEWGDLKEIVANDQQTNMSFKDLIAPHVLKPLIISLGVMVFQQFSGINAVLFNLQTIFAVYNLYEFIPLKCSKIDFLSS